MKKSGKGYYEEKSLKIIDLVMFDIYNHEKDILEVGYKKKTIETKDK